MFYYSLKDGQISKLPATTRVWRYQRDNQSESVNRKWTDNTMAKLLHEVESFGFMSIRYGMIRVITKLPNSEQSYKGKVKTHKYINRQNQSTTGKP